MYIFKSKPGKRIEIDLYNLGGKKIIHKVINVNAGVNNITIQLP